MDAFVPDGICEGAEAAAALVSSSAAHFLFFPFSLLGALASFPLASNTCRSSSSLLLSVAGPSLLSLDFAKLPSRVCLPGPSSGSWTVAFALKKLLLELGAVGWLEIAALMNLDAPSLSSFIEPVPTINPGPNDACRSLTSVFFALLTCTSYCSIDLDIVGLYAFLQE